MHRQIRVMCLSLSQNVMRRHKTSRNASNVVGREKSWLRSLSTGLGHHAQAVLLSDLVKGRNACQRGGGVHGEAPLMGVVPGCIERVRKGLTVSQERVRKGKGPYGYGYLGNWRYPFLPLPLCTLTRTTLTNEMRKGTCG